MFAERTNATILLERIGYPRTPRPEFPANGDAQAFWTQICTNIENGVMPAGPDLQPLVAAAARMYPGNPSFQPAAALAAAPPEERAGNEDRQRRPSVRGTPSSTNENTFVYLLVRGWPEVETLLDRARHLAMTQGRASESVALEIANDEGVLLSLANWTTEQAVPLARELRVVAQHGGQVVSASVTTNAFQDYLKQNPRSLRRNDCPDTWLHRSS